MLQRPAPGGVHSAPVLSRPSQLNKPTGTPRKAMTPVSPSTPLSQAGTPLFRGPKAVDLQHWRYEEELLAIFALIEDDENGVIDFSELLELGNGMSASFTVGKCRAVLGWMDEDHDSAITKEVFVSFFRKIMKNSSQAVNDRGIIQARTTCQAMHCRQVVAKDLAHSKYMQLSCLSSCACHRAHRRQVIEYVAASRTICCCASLIVSACMSLWCMTYTHMY